MTGRRLALVTRRFWPMVGGAEMVMANLACEFRRLGHQPTIVTARWESSWPREVVHREVPVVRLPNPPQRGWGTMRYMTALWRWLRRRRSDLDAVLVSMLKHDAYTAITALRGSGVPIVLRAEGAGESGDCQWHVKARFGRRIQRRCYQADALAAPSDAIVQEMLTSGFPAERVHYVPNGVPLPPLRDSARQADARAALREVNHDLAAGAAAPVVLYTGRLHRAKGLHELIAAWPTVLKQFPEARLWLVGEGSERDELYERILDQELRGRVVMPGAFDDVDEVLQAADLFVLPSYEEGMSLALLEAMAAGLPIVATDIPGNRKLIEHEAQGLLVPPRDVKQLADGLLRQLSQPILARSYAQAARNRVEQQYSITSMAERHLQLMETAAREHSR